MSVFETVGMMIGEINIFVSGMFLAFFALSFGLARAITKDSKQMPVLLTLFTSFFAIITITDFKMGMQMLVVAAIGTMAWFIPMFKRNSKRDLAGEE